MTIKLRPRAHKPAMPKARGMLCLVMPKEVYEQTTWPQLFAELAESLVDESGCELIVLNIAALTTLAGSPDGIPEMQRVTPKDHALLYEHSHNKLAYLALQKF